MNFSIVIPCLNEIETIEKAVYVALQSATKHNRSKFEIIVADNGSTDGTLEKLSNIKNIKIINVPVRGYGAALHWGILSAKYPYVLYADADLSYDFNELSKFLSVLKVEYDLVLGSRLLGHMQKGAMPFLNRYFGTPVLTFLIRLLYGIKTSDCNSGMRMIKKSFYRSLQMKNCGMEWASELLIRTAIFHGKYFEIPINFKKDQRNKKPHLKRWEDGWRHLKAIMLFKPLFFNIIAIILISFGLIFLSSSIINAIAMFLSAEFFVFSYIAARKIQSSFEEKPDQLNQFLDRMPLVLFAIFLSFSGFILIFIISDKYLILKYILLFQIIIFDLWLFFIETIKTYLLNPLPKNIR